MRVARLVARVIGWLFVADIAYHAVLAASDGFHAAADGKGLHTAGYFALGLVATALVVVALLAAKRSFTRTR